jgi:hypothetical protein
MPYEAGVRLDHMISKLVLGEDALPLPYSRSLTHAQTLLQYWMDDNVKTSHVFSEKPNGSFSHTVVLLDPSQGPRIQHLGVAHDLALAICRAFVEA